MRKLTVAAAWLVLAAYSSGPDVDALAWRSGDWVSETGDRWTEESWTSPRGGMLLGMGRSGRGPELRDWEYMRIVPGADGRPVFWGSPKGAPAVPFRLVSLTATEAVFANPSHDYPQRIVYRREGAALVATISAADGSRATSWRYKRR